MTEVGSDELDSRGLGSDEGRKRVHPALWIVLFFTLLIVLEAGFFVVASVQPDDRIAPTHAEPGG